MTLIFESLSILANASARAGPASDNSASLLSSAFSAWRTMKTVVWLKELESARPTRKQQSTKRFFMEQSYHEPREVDESRFFRAVSLAFRFPAHTVPILGSSIR